MPSEQSQGRQGRAAGQGPLEGQVVLVTGATGNVGWGVAHAAAAAGASLVLTGRSPAAVEALRAEFQGERVLVLQVDPLGESSLVEARRQVLARFGGLDHVVSSMGGWWQKGASLEQPPEELAELLGTYVQAPWLLAKTLVPALRKPGGSFLLVTGALGEGHAPGAGLLVTAVVGQFGLSRALRAELAGGPVRFIEFRIACRVERAARPGVVPSKEAGQEFVEVMSGAVPTGLVRYEGPGRRTLLEGAK